MTWFGAALGAVAIVALFAAAAGDQPGFITYDEVRGAPYTVSYDKNSLKINGKPSVFLSGSIHYPRGTPAVWDVVLDEAKADGLNAIEMYTFWDVHEPAQGQYVWSGRANVTAFLDLCKQKGLFVIFRIGPYVCGEYDYGGLPVWVGQVPGIKFRTFNEQWTSLVADWMKTIVSEVRGYFADKGGPIMLAQVENEYEPRNDQDREYVKWCGEMADAMQLTVPWIMCNGASADNTINTCNANDCVAFLEKNGQSGRILVDQPALWTENEGWFQNWGFPYPDRGTNATLGYVQSRTPEDIAYASARWFARGGTLMNYYMWYGGNHYRQPGSSIATWYANDVNLNADTLPNEPKKTHLKNMHLAVAAAAESLLVSGPQINSSVALQWFNNQTGTWEDGSGQFAFVYGQPPNRIAFVENSVDQPVLTRWEGHEFTMPPLSMSIANEDGEELWNSGKVPSAALRRVHARAHEAKLDWEMWRDPLFAYACQQPITDRVPYEQLNLTKGFSDYAVYSTQFDWNQPAGLYNLSIDTHMSQAFVVLVDGVLVANLYDTTHSDQPLPLFGLVQVPGPGSHNITILSVSLGVDNSIVSGDPPKIKGVTGRVVLGPLDLTGAAWTMQGQLAGECLQVYTKDGAARVNWADPSPAPHSWYQAAFDTPSRLDGAATRTALLFNATGLDRGFAYVNGQPVGRFWLIEGRAWGRSSGRPSQDVYFVPWDYLNEDGANTITLFAELPGDLSAPYFMVSSLVAVDSEDSEDWELGPAAEDEGDEDESPDQTHDRDQDQEEADEEEGVGEAADPEDPDLAELVQELATHDLEAAGDEGASERTAEETAQPAEETAQPEDATAQPEEQTRPEPGAQDPPQPQQQGQEREEGTQQEETRSQEGPQSQESTQDQEAATPPQTTNSSEADQNVLAVM